MLTKILILTGLALTIASMVMINFSNPSGWQFFTIGIVLMALGGLAHDLAHPKPRRREIEDTERPLKRKKRRVKVPAGY